MTGGGPGSTNVPYFVFQKSIGGGWEFGQASSFSIVVVVASIVIATVGAPGPVEPAGGGGGGMSDSTAPVVVGERAWVNRGARRAGVACSH